ncbi:hypothetical protein tb265_11730 [Gemmatimonadetes bacterium T265]|nr:hypothetical protein tb265_11730 [Gemmatimonadetes bacterium T265]
MSSYVTPYDPTGGDAGLPRSGQAVPPAVLWLVVANVAVAFLQLTVQRDLPELLGFAGGTVAATAAPLGGAWWTAFTYMFVHAGFWHLALNLYTLWVFGPRLERAWGTKAFAAFYVWCGLGGAAAHAVFTRGPSLLVGASAAIFGVLLAYALRWPDDEALFFGVVPMKVWWLVAFLAAINLVMGVLDVAPGSAMGGTAHLAHLGGFVFAALWLFRPAAPDVDRLRQRVAPAPDIVDGLPRAVPRGAPRDRDGRDARGRDGQVRERGSAADQAVEQSRALTARPPAPAPRPSTPRPPAMPPAATPPDATPPTAPPTTGGAVPPAVPPAGTAPPSAPPPVLPPGTPARGTSSGGAPGTPGPSGALPSTGGPPSAVPPRPPRRVATPVAGVGAAGSRADTLDRLLDKISATGIESLTGEERQLLDETAKKLRGQ